MAAKRFKLWDLVGLFDTDHLESVLSDSLVTFSHLGGLENSNQTSADTTPIEVINSDSKTIFCTSCRVNISDTSHYKSDWHRLNVKLRSVGVDPMTLEKFENLKIEGEDSSDEEDHIDQSSSSKTVESGFKQQQVTASSSSQKDSNPLDIAANTKSARITFVSKDKLAMMIWKSVLLGGKNHTVGEFVQSVLTLGKESSNSNLSKQIASSSSSSSSNSIPAPKQQKPFNWIIMLCQGGYFAAAAFDHDVVLKHKRIARYTTRRKQGGAQASKDQTKSIQSAGSSLRRYNETRLKEEICELMDNWKSEFEASSRIFLYAPSYNASSFFFEGSPISRRDPRVRNIPFVTHRPSFVEVQRIHQVLSTVETQPWDDNLLNQLQDSGVISNSSSSQLQQTSLNSSFSSIQESLASSQSILLDSSSNASASQYPTANSQAESQPAVDLMAEAIRAGSVQAVQELLDQDYLPPLPEDRSAVIWPLMLAVMERNIEIVKCLINGGENLDGRSPKFHFRTALHAACEQGSNGILELLLEEGANPGISDLYNQKPYDLCKDKASRNIMRKFAGANPDLWDYANCHIEALTDEMEAQSKQKEAEKRKRKKAAQKEKKKLAKEEEESKLQADAEKERQQEEENLAKSSALERTKKIMSMSDREKRAYAAERRQNPTALQCDFCGKNISTTPYEQNSFKYCTTDCVVEHKRLQNALAAGAAL